MEKEDKGNTLTKVGCTGECFFWYQPTWVVLDKRPLNRYSYSCYHGHGHYQFQWCVAYVRIVKSQSYFYDGHFCYLFNGV